MQIHLWFDAHARSKLAIAVLALFENNLHWNPLNDLDVVAGGIFRRQHAEKRTRRTGYAVHVTPIGTAVRVNFDSYRLSHPHMLELTLLEIGGDPDLIKWDHGQQLLTGLDVPPDDHILVHLACDWRD